MPINTRHRETLVSGLWSTGIDVHIVKSYMHTCKAVDNKGSASQHMYMYVFFLVYMYMYINDMLSVYCEVHIVHIQVTLHIDVHK